MQSKGLSRVFSSTTVHAKVGTKKDINGMDLTEAENITRWQEYTEKLYKKIFMTQIITIV